MLSDLILWLADGGAFRPLWSADIIEELRRNLVSNGLAPNVVEKRLTSMTRYFPDAMVEGYEHLVTGMRCDEKDRHVLAAAVRSKPRSSLRSICATSRMNQPALSTSRWCTPTTFFWINSICFRASSFEHSITSRARMTLHP